MNDEWGIIIFGVIEVIIGAVTLFAVGASFFLEKSTKPPEVLIFVLTTSAISLSLGIGILKHSITSYRLLLYFATVIILSKILIFSRIIILSGALDTSLSQSTKNIISVIYHGLLVLYFIRPSVRAKFGEKRNILFSLKSLFRKW